MIRVLFVGDSWSPQYVKAFYDAACNMNDVEADIFDNRYYWENKSFLYRVEKHYRKGFLLYLLNRRLVKQCREQKYDLVFFYGTSLIYPSTVKRIKETRCQIFMYCNDCPFSKWYKPYSWGNFRKALQYSDIAYAYRESDVESYKSHGARNVKILRSYYIANRNFYIPDDEIVIDVPDVVYIGHRENDKREDYIRALLQKGIRVGLNHSWNDFEPGCENLVHFDRETSMVHYNELINKAKIAIVFLSSINNDTYTRRCFEIPAAKTLMVAPYTETIASMYEDGKEAVLFKDKNEFVDKISYYLERDDERREIAEAGYKRLLKESNETKNRIEQILKDYCNIIGDRK